MKIRSIASALLLLALALTSCNQQNTDVKTSISASTTSTDVKVIYIKTSISASTPADTKLFPFGNHDKFGFIDRSGKVVVPAKFDNIDEFSEDLARVQIGEKYGYIDKTGKIFIPAQFDSAGIFSEGLAFVRFGEKREKRRYIDFSRGLTLVIEFDEKSGYSGYIDKAGKTIVIDKLEWGSDFKNGLAIVKIGNKYGYIDKAGKIVIPTRFDEVDEFNDGLAIVKIGNKYGYIDKTGKMVIAARFDSASNFSEGLAVVEIGNKYGYIDKTGKMIISARFDGASSFSEGLAVVEIEDKKGYVDKTGKMVVPAKFSIANSFEGGMAEVEYNNNKVESRFIDRTGNFIYPHQRNIFKQNGRYGYKNRAGKVIIQPEYDKVSDFDRSLARVCKDKKCGYIDKTGKIIIPLKFDDAAEKFKDSLAWVVVGNRLGYINTFGQLKIPPRFNFSSGDDVYYSCKWPEVCRLPSLDFDGGLAHVIMFRNCESTGCSTCYRYGYLDTTGKLVFEFNEDAPKFPATAR